MLRPAYLSKKLTPPIPTKDGGTLRTILEAYEYMTTIGKERELRPHWHRVRELMLQEAEVAAVSSQVRLAVLKDASLTCPRSRSRPHEHNENSLHLPRRYVDP
jgi:hypothetical protein